MIKCILIEDEKLAQDVIKTHLKRIDGFELTGVCDNTLEAAKLLSKQVVDVIFLDIQLPGMTGLNFLSTLEDPPFIVLTTAYSEYALESYNFNVIDYLLKPISFERFLKTVNKIKEVMLINAAAKENKPSNNYIFIKSNNRFFKVNFSEIIYVEGMKDYLKIHTSNTKLITLQTMSEMEKLLPPSQFIRVHKSYIVAVSCIKSIYGNTIELSKADIPVGINYKEKIILLKKQRFQS